MLRPFHRVLVDEGLREPEQAADLSCREQLLRSGWRSIKALRVNIHRVPPGFALAKRRKNRTVSKLAQISGKTLLLAHPSEEIHRFQSVGRGPSIHPSRPQLIEFASVTPQ